MVRTSIKAIVLPVLTATILTGCGSVPTPGKVRFERKLDVVTQADTRGMDPIAAAAYWGTRFDRAQNDPKIAVEFSKALRAVGNDEEALRVVQHAHTRLGDDPDLLLELGKALISNDRPHEAVRPIQTAIVLSKENDWTAHSALGVAHDRVGDHRQAIVQYDRALALSPAQPQVLNNKGLSYALSGRKQLAEQTLRTATTLPGGSAHIRQNYALVLALSGKTHEAERLARSDLPPTIADGNVSYYQSLVSQPAYWQSLQGDNVVQPDFGDDASNISNTPHSTPVVEPGGPTRSRAPVRPAVPKVKGKPAPDLPSPSASASAAQTGSASVASAGQPMSLPYQD